MFTGIIEELGKVKAIQVLPDAIRLTIEGPLVVSDVNRGDSISVSGACLTAVEHDATSFTADVMQETLKLTSLDGIQVGDPVNLERAMTAATRFGSSMCSTACCARTAACAVRCTPRSTMQHWMAKVAPY